jgi:hypothetical protein
MDPADFFQERLGELGDLRVYYRPGPPEHVAFEVLRETDGRAWTLRVPWQARAVVRHLLADALRIFGEGASLAFDEQGCAELARGLLADGDELAAVMLRQEGERAFAVWRREQTRQGWSWTLDLVLVPEVLATPLCTRMLAGLDRLDQPRRWPGPSASGPSAATPSQPPSASTRSISRR